MPRPPLASCGVERCLGRLLERCRVGRRLIRLSDRQQLVDQREHRRVRPHLSTNGACLRPDQRFGIGARVDTTDGHVGNLTRVVIDPVAQALTHLAMHMLLQSGYGEHNQAWPYYDLGMPGRAPASTRRAGLRTDRVPLGEVDVYARR